MWERSGACPSLGLEAEKRYALREKSLPELVESCAGNSCPFPAKDHALCASGIHFWKEWNVLNGYVEGHLQKLMFNNFLSGAGKPTSENKRNLMFIGPTSTMKST